MRYDTGAPVNAFDERDPARLRRLITWELALRTADHLAHREITGDGSELHASVIHRELHTDFMPIVSDTSAYTSPVIAAPDENTLTDPTSSDATWPPSRRKPKASSRSPSYS